MTTTFARTRLDRGLLALLLAALALAPRPVAAQETVLRYAVDVTERADDRFRVTLTVDGLAPENAVLQFPATAPGTYQVMDVGRFVEDLTAADAEGRPIPVERVATNQWRIGDPTRARTIAWRVAETWDTPVEEKPIYPMAGTSLEADHVLFNAHAVLAFPTGLEDAPVRIALTAPEGWVVGTALEKDGSGAYVAEDYGFLVDSPILAGELSVATTAVAGAPIEIYTYSESGRIRSDMLLESMEATLRASGAFLERLPVDRYVFLYHFEGRPTEGAIYGAWEHSYSSEYVFPDVPWSAAFGQTIADVAAHEFLHVVTPLHIHSEIIETFDFETPVPSRHLWLYEGVTEWAAHAVQLYAGLKSPEAYLEETARKVALDRRYDAETSLEELALTSYTEEGQEQYANIYQRGALVAGLLDLRLLQLSDGRRGLRELVLDLMERYGKERPFDDASFHQVVVEMTDPAIGDFLERYVVNAESLPIAEAYATIGVRFVDDPEAPRFEILPDPTPEQRRLREAWMGKREGGPSAD